MMFVVTPALGWALPLVWPFVLSVAGAKGYLAMTSSADDAPLRGRLTREMNALRTVALPLEQVVADMMADEVRREEVLRFQKDGIVLVFKRDSRGKFAIEVTGPAERTKRDLEGVATDFANALVQEFAFNKVVAELERKGATAVEEETVNEEGDVVIKMRRWT